MIIVTVIVSVTIVLPILHNSSNIALIIVHNTNDNDNRSCNDIINNLT